MNIFSLPLGIKEYTTKDVKKIDFISSVILEESELWGFKKIITPIFENINSLNVGLKEETINFVLGKFPCTCLLVSHQNP